MMSDEEVINLILEGRKDLFRLIVERYQGMVFRTCVGFLHNKDDAEDLTQDVFIQAFQSLKKFRQESSFPTWLYRIAVNASLNKIKRSPFRIFSQKSDKRTFVDEEDKTLSSLPDYNDPEKRLIQHEHQKMVQKALDSLPVKQKIAIVLSKYDELSQKEISEIMGITEGAVESLLQRAKTNLRQKLSYLRKNFH